VKKMYVFLRRRLFTLNMFINLQVEEWNYQTKQNVEALERIKNGNLRGYEDDSKRRRKCYLHFVHEAMVCTEQMLILYPNYITRYICPFSPGSEILLRLLKELISIFEKKKKKKKKKPFLS
jgi:hypothetical protein